MKKYKEQRYKNLLNIREIPYQNNLRILKFKRPKWNFLKKKIQRQANKIFFFRKYKKLNKNFSFYNQKGYIIPCRWTNIRFRYKEMLLAKRRLFLFLSLKTKLRTLKKNINNRTSLNFLIKLETRLDILLWRIGIFSSPAISRFFLNHRKIKLNNKIVNISSIFIKKGDIISVSDDIRNYILINLRKFRHIKTYTKKFVIFQDIFNSFVPYFVESNWDLLEFVCLQNTDELNIKGMLHMYPKNLNIVYFKHYLRRL